MNIERERERERAIPSSLSTAFCASSAYLYRTNAKPLESPVLNHERYGMTSRNKALFASYEKKKKKKKKKSI
jgi:hypothetical protein